MIQAWDFSKSCSSQVRLVSLDCSLLYCWTYKYLMRLPVFAWATVFIGLSRSPSMTWRTALRILWTHGSAYWVGTLFFLKNMQRNLKTTLRVAAKQISTQHAIIGRHTKRIKGPNYQKKHWKNIFSCGSFLLSPSVNILNNAQQTLCEDLNKLVCTCSEREFIH